MVENVFLLLGSNLGDRTQILQKASSIIENQIGEINLYSSVYETLAWGVEDQPAFLNQVLVVSTLLKPQELLTTINRIEKEMGRIRHEKWGERLIDIDILYYNNVIINAENLKIPHPEIINRKFTLVPLVEIAAKFLHPIIKKTQLELLESCKDKLEVSLIA